jgi:hypothetical protein
MYFRIYEYIHSRLSKYNQASQKMNEKKHEKSNKNKCSCILGEGNSITEK